MFKGLPTYITSVYAELGLLMTFLELFKRKNGKIARFDRDRARTDLFSKKKKKKKKKLRIRMLIYIICNA